MRKQPPLIHLPMRQPTAPCVPAALAFITGLVATQYAGAGWWWSAAGAGGAMAAGGRCRRRVRWAGLILLWVSLGAIRMAGWAAHPDTALQRMVPAHPAPVQVVGVVMDDPTIVADGSGGSDDGQCATLALQAARWQDRWHALHGRVRLVLRGPHPVVRYGDEVLASGSWAHPPAAGNPGQYDVRAALARQRVHAVSKAA